MTGTPKPLNGTKTHPLSAHALEVMEDLRTRPLPRQELNPGVLNRLYREGLIEDVDLPSPYKKHKGAKIRFVRARSA